ncbi:MAG: maltokinase N-terminal cap-like domain-containing protein [Actinomycetes bacterium]
MNASGPTSPSSVTPPAHAPSVEELAQFLGRQRWFGGKSRAWQVTGAADLGWLRREDPAVRILLVTVTYDDGETETYQLPLVHHQAPVETLMHVLVAEVVADGADGADGARTYVFDALHDKEATELWWTGITQSTQGDGWAFHRDPSASELPDAGPSLVVGAEQSNTSLIFGDSVILKVFRKVSPGINPDIEIHSALAAAGSTAIASPLGWLEGRWPGTEAGATSTASLAMAQVFLRDATEGWELAKTSVRDLYGEADLHADEVGGDFASEAARLGAATADVHEALARTLPTATLDAKQIQALADGMRERLDRAVAEVAELAPYAAGLRGAFDDLADLPGDVPVQRVHGDFHLGQVMRAVDGWKLLDFEGEPARPLLERRSLDSKLKDVAGMLRSFDYAARHLLVDYPADPQREYRATEWADRNRDAFCNGYADACGRDPRKDPVLLRAFETDKAIYEVVYEARNRPTWLAIPMSAIQRLSTIGQPAAGRPEEGTP